jgi:hypothetical protein
VTEHILLLLLLLLVLPTSKQPELVPTCFPNGTAALQHLLVRSDPSNK